MAQPIWITPAGSLGTIPEGVFYEVPLEAYEPSSQPVFYQVIAGQLPAGIEVDDVTGRMMGVPLAIALVDGVPAPVSRDVTSKFVVRAYTKTILGTVDRLADRTFEITVSGEDVPEFVTPAGNIATYFDGSQISDLQIEFSDIDPGDILTVSLISGQLPPGLSVSPTGLISGFIAANANNQTTVNYEFVLEVSDGRNSNIRNFSILVYSRAACTADNTIITADNTFVTADCSPIRTPIILTPEGSIGTAKNDNFYAFRFIGLDLDGDQFEFVATTALPPGLTLDSGSGWLYGYLPDLGITENIYNFSLRVFKIDSPDVISNDYDYSLTVTGPINTDITWLTPSYLGTIDNGSISTLYVQAVNRGGLQLRYQLQSGSDSNLPQGLELLPSGEIAGRVSFNTFALDSGTTTFDVNNRNVYNLDANPFPGAGTETTFDMTHTFTVNAFSLNGVVSVFKTFTIRVIRAYNEPFDNIYIEAMPPLNDREILANLLQSPDIFPPDLIYRKDDANFGVARRVVYFHAYGLTAATLDDYVQSLELNHYWKNLVLGEIKTARALDGAGNVVYEIVYSEIIDNLVNNDGVSVSKEVFLPYALNANTPEQINAVYPNSLVDMRTQVIDTVGQVSNVLPLWMTSTQADGRVLGFVPAWIIAYTKPGASGRIKYNIDTIFGTQLNLVDFQVDRYELQKLLSHNWDPVTQSWVPTPAETSFDITNHYQLPEPNDSSLAFTGGIDYAVGDQIRILGSQIGGVDGTNDVIVTVTSVDSLGTIETAYGQGSAPLFTQGNIYYNVVGTNISGTGSGATWDIQVVPGEVTQFDYSSVRFVAPVDMYGNTQIYDKYLLFPKRNILV